MLPRPVILFATFLLAATAIARARAPEPPPPRVPFSGFPMELGAWHGRQQPAFDEKTLATLGLDDYLTRTYSSRESAAGLYVGYWASQQEGDTIHSPLNCLPGSGWEPLSKRALAIPIEDAGVNASTRSIVVNRYVVQKGVERELVLYWYQSRGRVVASEYAGKFFLVADAIRFHRTDAALVRVLVDVADEPGGETRAEQEGTRFIKTLFPALAPYLPA